MGIIAWVKSRRMKLLERDRFIDVVSGKGVNLYLDDNGDKWLAESAWSWFRVRSGW